MALSLDGHATGGAASAVSTTVTLTTTKANDIIVVQAVGINASAVTVSTVSDTANLTWAKRKALVFNTNDTLEVWWAFSAGILTNDVITVTMSASLTTIALNAFAVNGANTTAPWDVNASLPDTNTGSNSIPTVTGISTSASISMLLGFSAELTSLTETAGSGYTIIDSNTVGIVVTAANQYQIVSGSQVSVSEAFGTTTTANWSMIADAIVDGLQPWFETPVIIARRAPLVQSMAAIAPVIFGIELPGGINAPSRRQGILQGFPSPTYVDETGTRQAITAGAVYLNEKPPFPVAAWGWEQYWIQPPARSSVVDRYAGIVGGDTGTEAAFIATVVTTPTFGFEQTLFAPRYRIKQVIAWDDGAEAQLINWYNFGWEIQPPQPAHLRTEKAGSIQFGDLGTQAAFISWYNTGWQVQPWQAPHPRPERSGATAPISVIDALFNNWFNAGWEIQPPPPPHTHAERGVLLRGIDGIEGPFVGWYNAGWEIQSVQPPHLKPEKAGSIMPVLAGIEAPYIFVAPLTYGFDPPILYPRHNFRDFSQLFNIDAIFVNWQNDGWEIQPPQPPHPRPERAASIMRGDEGDEATFAPWFNFGWDVQPPQPPHFRAEKVGSILKGIDGNEVLYNFWRNAGWEIQAYQPQHLRIERSASIAPISVIDAQFVGWYNSGWEIQPVQPPHLKPERNAGIMRGDDGTQASLINWFNAGWQIEPPFFTRWRWEKSAAIMPIEPGIEARFNNWINVGGEVQPWQPPHFKPEKIGSLLKGIDSTDFIYQAWLNGGWAVQPFQPSHPRPENSGSVAPSLVIDAPFIYWANAGWEIQPPQPPHPSPERDAGITRGIDGSEAPFMVWFNAGWEIQPPFFTRLRWEKSASVMPIEAGIEAPYVFTPTFALLLWGWEDKSVLFPRHNFLDFSQNFNIDAVFNSWRNAGWEIQPPQPPHRNIERYASILRGDDGAQARLINWFNAGWEVQPFQPPHRAPEIKAASFLRGDEGAEAKFIPWFVEGWEIQPPQPPHPRPERAGTINYALGIEAAFINWANIGWPVQPWQPPHPRPERSAAFMPIPGGIEAKFIFVPPPPLFAWGHEFLILPRGKSRLDAAIQQGVVDFPFFPFPVITPPSGGGKRRPWPGIPLDPYGEPSKKPQKIVPVWDRKTVPDKPAEPVTPGGLLLPPGYLFSAKPTLVTSTPPDLAQFAPPANSAQLASAQDRTDEQDIQDMQDILKALGLS